ncbi:alcohol dehydrogenase catalytic domain-containing protein [Saxibacter everestensis]|uniref:Alcohol dehydrogenase catalytic domain-containing protein n=1 Tax=Saxibacter everestensis TaxID=2909229 RepID=A0ABY8QYR4_9MICO|nr:alcohol dehydrogenase catalytic domain-containing protein [Brevibacteriaceae bacterium ZFBP1038]
MTVKHATTFRPGSGVGQEPVHVSAPGPGQVGVSIRATGVCHSDLHIVNGDWPAEQPLVLGHEAAGVVDEIGPGVTTVQPGDHVVLSWFAPCMRCSNCAAGRGWLCTGTTALDNTLPDGTTPFTDDQGKDLWPYLGLGTFAPQVVVPETAAVKVDDDLPFAVGALLGCSVTTGVGAVLNTARVPAGASAVVIGCGGVGLSVVMGLKLAGAHPIVAVDFSPEKRAKAAELGATITIDPRDTDLTAYVNDHLGGVDFAFEAIGNEKVIETLPGLLAPGGSAVLVGMTRIGARSTIDPYDLADQGKSILGCNYGSSVARVDIPRLAKLHLAGHLPLEQLIDKVRPLAEAGLALDELAAGTGLRSVLTPTG